MRPSPENPRPHSTWTQVHLGRNVISSRVKFREPPYWPLMRRSPTAAAPIKLGPGHYCLPPPRRAILFPLRVDRGKTREEDENRGGVVYEKFRSPVLPPRTLQNLLRPIRGHCRRCVTRECVAFVRQGGFHLKVCSSSMTAGVILIILFWF